MGNQPSSSGQRSSPQSPNEHRGGGPGRHHASHGHAHAQAVAHGNATLHAARDLNPRRRESIHGLSFKAGAAPPSASLESARSQTAAPPASTQAADVVASTLRAAHENSIASQAPDDRMGAEQSRPRPSSARDPNSGSSTSRARSAPSSGKPSPSPQSQPVDVPLAPRDEPLASRTEAVSVPSAPMSPQQTEYFVPQPQFARAPRLPLPIEEEVHTPGSPIISPADLAPVDIEVEGLPRRASVLSSTTADDDDLGEEFQGPQNVPTVPTLIEWEGPGERVYVTGTFVEWSRKFRLHRNGPSKKKDVLSAIVNIAPGTHHLKFIVDGEMTTSDKLPTAVDYTNILVNYLEVSLDDVPQPATDAKEQTEPPQPTPVQELRAPPGIYPPQTLPPTPELLPVQQPVVEAQQPKAPPAAPSAQKYHSVIPRYLLDLDAPEESSRFARANAATNNADSLPTPPTLPMFLNKSILNGATPMKDDSSVLIMPNHTVLNHLATSSIKDNILATSATTRYKQKFLTTIMYKPKHEEAA